MIDIDLDVDQSVDPATTASQQKQAPRKRRRLPANNQARR